MPKHSPCLSCNPRPPPLQQAPPAHQVEVWTTGVCSDTFHPRFRSADMRARLSGGHPEAPLLLSVGRLGNEKNLKFLKVRGEGRRGEERREEHRSRGLLLGGPPAHCPLPTDPTAEHPGAHARGAPRVCGRRPCPGGAEESLCGHAHRFHGCVLVPFTLAALAGCTALPCWLHCSALPAGIPCLAILNRPCTATPCSPLLARCRHAARRGAERCLCLGRHLCHAIRDRDAG